MIIDGNETEKHAM
jgi:hypothetical protein